MLKVNINGLYFKNPVIAASGTFGFGSEYNNFYESIRRQSLYKSEEGRTMLKLEEGNTHTCTINHNRI